MEIVSLLFAFGSKMEAGEGNLMSIFQYLTMRSVFQFPVNKSPAVGHVLHGRRFIAQRKEELHFDLSIKFDSEKSRS